MESCITHLTIWKQLQPSTEKVKQVQVYIRAFPHFVVVGFFSENAWSTFHSTFLAKVDLLDTLAGEPALTAANLSFPVALLSHTQHWKKATVFSKHPTTGSIQMLCRNFFMP